jgi:hypothetical protein
MSKVTELPVTPLDWYNLVYATSKRMLEKSTPIFCACAHSSRMIVSLFGLRGVIAIVSSGTAWDPTTLKGFRIRHSTGNQAIGGKVDRDRIAILVYRVFYIKSP